MNRRLRRLRIPGPTCGPRAHFTWPAGLVVQYYIQIALHTARQSLVYASATAVSGYVETFPVVFQRAEGE